MTGKQWKPTPTDHVIIVEGKRRELWSGTADKIQAAEARLRAARLTRLAQLDQAAARLANLERPPQPVPEPDPVEVQDRPPVVSAPDAGWVIDGWRDEGWQS